jgi:hypothetical protein
MHKPTEKESLECIIQETPSASSLFNFLFLKIFKPVSWKCGTDVSGVSVQ